MPDSPKEFKKVSKENLSDQIIWQIKEMIENKIFKPGDMLPSERELASKLGVSRLPLREALKTLQFINVIDSRPGSGYIVKDLKIANLLDIMEEAAESGQPILHDLKEMRITIEVKAAELACEKRTEKDLKRMAEAIEEMEQEFLSYDEKLVEASINFHNAVLKASHNKLFVVILDSFSDVIHADRRRALTIKDRYRTAIDEHRNIYNAIKNRDSEAATRLMKFHLEKGY